MEQQRESEQTRMAAVYLLLARGNLMVRVTHLCPRGPEATGLVPDLSEERDVDVVMAWLERAKGADMHTYCEPGRYGQQAKNVSLVANGTLNRIP